MEDRKRIIKLNEHNEILAAEKIVTKLKNKQTAALLATLELPVFLDPGTFLLRLCYQNKIPITSVADCSLSLALSLVPFEMSSFHFGGFLDRNSLLRKKQILSFQTKTSQNKINTKIFLCFKPLLQFSKVSNK